MQSRRISLIVGSIVVAGVVLALPSTAAAQEFQCAEFTSQAEAQAYLVPGSPRRLDPDGDGVACEETPCPCAYVDSRTDSPGFAPSAAPPHPLTKRTARLVSTRLVRAAVGIEYGPQRAAFGECRRRSPRRFGCALTGRGATKALKTTCHYRAEVRARQGRYVARIATQNCHQQRLAKLTYARALQAFETRLGELVDVPAQIGIYRTSRTSFVGSALWKPHADRDDLCILGATIEFGSSRLVLVTTELPVCFVSA